MGGRTRSDANDAVGIHGARHRLRWRRQTQSDQKRHGRHRFDRKVSRPSRLEARRTLAARGARAYESGVAGGRPFDPTSARKVGGLGCHARLWEAAAERQLAGGRRVALWAGWPELPSLRKLPSLSQMEPVAELFADGSLLCDASGRRATYAPRQPGHPENQL